MKDVIQIDEARRKHKAKRPTPDGWQSLLAVGDSGAIRGSIGNLTILLEHDVNWHDVFAYDERAAKVCVMRPSPLDQTIPERCRAVPRAFSDVDAFRLANWGETYSDPLFLPGVFAPPEKWIAAVQVEAQRHRFDPVRMYLDGLVWDGVQRIDEWTMRYLGAVPRDETHRLYLRAVGAAWMTSAVARAYKPGCKADAMLVLEGPQGCGKSTALATLAGPEFFTDELGDLGSKDAAMQVHGPWILELAELDAVGKAEAAAIKAFLSRRVDKFRAPYGRTVEEYPRRCVFAGTTNESAYLRDPTGNRRFWPVRCDKIDIAALEADRDQLWAEAVVRFRDGAAWHLVASAVLEAATEEQASRQEVDLWHDVVADYLEHREQVSISAILDHIGIPVQQQGRREQTRAAHILQAMGWERRRVREGDRLAWAYRKEGR